MGVKFTLDIPRIGHILAVRYDRKKFNIFSEGIYQKQIWELFKKEDALYTHVAISSGGPHIVNVTPPKARLVGLVKTYKGSYVKLLRFKGKDFDNHIRYKIACMYNAFASNLKYDWWGIIHFIIPRIKQMDDKPFCSEVCLKTYQMFYPDFLSGLYPSDCLPAHFVASKEFDTVWEGIVKE